MPMGQQSSCFGAALEMRGKKNLPIGSFCAWESPPELAGAAGCTVFADAESIWSLQKCSLDGMDEMVGGCLLKVSCSLRDKSEPINQLVKNGKSAASAADAFAELDIQ